MDRYADIKEKMLQYARQDSDIKAIVAIGSSTRENIKADEYSDLDLFIVTENADRWYSGEYPELLGTVSISFIEPTLGGGMEKRCIYDDDRDVDMIILSPDQFDSALKEGVCSWVMNRGYKVLYDINGYTDMIKLYVKHEVSHPDMSEKEFINIVNDFFFHNIWADKKIRRGELWSAKMCVDAYLKGHLLKMIETYCYEINGSDIWHDGRFLDRWAEQSVKDELKNCFAHYERDDIRSALLSTNALFERITRIIADKKGFTYPDKAAACAKKYINNTKDLD